MDDRTATHFELGQKVMDPITKVVGIVTQRTEYYRGSTRVGVEVAASPDGRPVEITFFEEQRLREVK
jgi:hypothetical protein